MNYPENFQTKHAGKAYFRSFNPFGSANIANDFLCKEVRTLHFNNSFRRFVALLLLVFAVIPLAAQKTSSPLKRILLPSPQNEALELSIRKTLLPYPSDAFDLIENQKSFPSPFRNFQVCYRKAVLQSYNILVFNGTDAGNAQLFYPDIPLSEFPAGEDLSGFTLVHTGQRWEKFRMEEVTSLSPPRADRVLVDEFGQERFREDWLLRFSDSSVRARVFRPDPVSRLQLPYGGLLRDRNDSSSALLRQAMDSVRIRISFENDSFRLKNTYMEFGEFSPPIRKKAVAASADSFWFDRNQPQFEEVNAFYHLNSFREYINGLGFDSLAKFPVAVDAHGLDGADQSAYSPLQGFIAYGDGNVDDAEDASVIIHEYGHVLCQAASPFGNSGQERRALEEGICDFLAGSYLRSMSSYMPNRLFRWDGNNEFWPGRSLASASLYPADLSGNLYADGGLFCSALHRLEESIGRNQTHRILLSALPALRPNISMTAAARFLLLSDSALSGGQFSAFIRQRFQERGIDPGLVVVSIPQQIKSRARLVFDDFLRPVLFAVNGIQSAEILDLSGRCRKLISLDSSGRSVILIAGLESGIYFLRCGNEVFRFPVQGPR